MKNDNDMLKDIDTKMSNLAPTREDKSTETSSYEPKDEHEEKGLSLGWKPNGKKSAKQWLEDYPLLKEIRQLDKANKDLATLLTSYINGQNKEKQDKQEAEIKQIRTEAIKMGDVETVEKIDKSIQETRAPKPQVDQVFQDFHTKYPQIFDPQSLEDLEIRQFFLKTDSALGTHLSAEKHMALLEQAILKQFPQHFGGSQDDEEEVLTPRVESGIQSNVKKSLRKRFTEHDLSPDQLATFKGFQKYNVPITVEQYIDKLQQQGDLK